MALWEPGRRDAAHYARDVPREEGEEGQRHYNRDKDSRDPIGKPLDRGLVQLRTLHEADDLTQRGVRAHTGGSDQEDVAHVNG